SGSVHAPPPDAPRRQTRETVPDADGNPRRRPSPDARREKKPHGGSPALADPAAVGAVASTTGRRTGSSGRAASREGSASGVDDVARGAHQRRQVPSLIRAELVAWPHL